MKKILTAVVLAGVALAFTSCATTSEFAVGGQKPTTEKVAGLGTVKSNGQAKDFSSHNEFEQAVLRMRLKYNTGYKISVVNYDSPIKTGDIEIDSHSQLLIAYMSSESKTSVEHEWKSKDSMKYTMELSLPYCYECDKYHFVAGLGGNPYESGLKITGEIFAATLEGVGEGMRSAYR